VLLPEHAGVQLLHAEGRLPAGRPRGPAARPSPGLRAQRPALARPGQTAGRVIFFVGQVANLPLRTMAGLQPAPRAQVTPVLQALTTSPAGTNPVPCHPAAPRFPAVSI